MDLMQYPFIKRFSHLCWSAGYAADTAICSVLREGPAMEVRGRGKRG